MVQFAALIAAFIAFFVVIWGLTYAFHNTSVKIASWLIWGSSLILLGASALWSFVNAVNSGTKGLGVNLHSMSDALGSFAFLWGLAAVFMLFSKRLFRSFRNNHVNGVDVVRRILLLAKNHHNLFGWVTLAAATAHGVYFLFHAPQNWSEFDSGIGAWVALVLLAVSGMLLGNVAKRPQRARVVRVSHVALTAGYVGAIVLHVHGSVLLATILFSAAFAAMALMWALMRLVKSAKRR